MSHVAIIYFSQTGTTDQIAKAISDGASSVDNCVCHMHSISGSEIVEGRFVNEHVMEIIDDADAVCFGSPTYMGGPAAQFKAFADASSDRWEEQQWAGKIASGFTVGTSPGGDQLCTLQYFSVLAAQHGMLWLGLDIPENHNSDTWNSQGTQLGFSGCVQSSLISDSDKLTANYLGQRLVKVSQQLGHS